MLVVRKSESFVRATEEMTDDSSSYARHLVILAIFTCFVAAVVFHFAGSSNFASSFLVGITVAILLIQIW
jgi:hypothetical protein